MMNKKQSLIQKARILEQQIKVKHETNQAIRKRSYELFLQDSPRPLPDLQKLREMRVLCFLAGNLLMTIPTIQIIFFYHTLFINGPDFIVSACGLLAIPMFFFSIIVDIAIWKRFGMQHTAFLKHINDIEKEYINY